MMFENSATAFPYYVWCKKACLYCILVPTLVSLVSMELKVSQDTLGSKGELDAPPINKTSISTSIMVNDAETIVLGGLFTDKDTNSSSRVPVLHKIPFLGRLFRTSNSEDAKTEILIFVTPRIVNLSENIR